MNDQEPDRRSLLKWTINGLGAMFTAVLGFPVISYLIDSRNRPAPPGNLRPVSGIRLSELRKDEPRQGVIRDVRRDAWTLHPNDVVGRVWVVKTDDATEVTSNNLRVFTTVCPHLGCSINANADPSTGFTCPCHNGKFGLDGALVLVQGGANPAPRAMDTLEFEVDNQDADLLRVRYVNFEQSKAEKIPRA